MPPALKSPPLRQSQHTETGNRKVPQAGSDAEDFSGRGLDHLTLL
jgi:hypothetical protein